MGRWGLDPDAALAIRGWPPRGGRRPPTRRPDLAALATADETDPRSRAGSTGVRRVAEAFPACVRHLANSAGTLRLPEPRFDAGRCGIALYRHLALQQRPGGRGPRRRASLDKPVAAWRRLAPGESSGYGRRLIAEAQMIVALVPVGYADGYPRTSPAWPTPSCAGGAAGRRDGLDGPAGVLRWSPATRTSRSATGHGAPRRRRAVGRGARGRWAPSATSSPRG